VLPPRFELHRPTHLAGALELKERYGENASFYAGGTELLVALKARVLKYEHIIDIKRLKDLHGVTLAANGCLRIGPLSTHHMLAHHPLIASVFPAYAALSDNIANIRVRVAGTIGGNLCFAEPHADPPALLCAVGAKLRLASPKGEREVPMEDFITGEFTTQRLESELLVSIEVPGDCRAIRAAYRSFGHLERPAVGVAATYSKSSDSRRWRFWVGAIAGRPTSMPDVEQAACALPPQTPSSGLLAEIERASRSSAELLEAHDDLHGSADYKRHLVSVLARRAAEACLQ
jgi:carbon-monoxide dehydrogenase medium subunit